MTKPPTSRLRRFAAKLNPFRWLPQTYRLQRQLKRVDRDYRARIAAAQAAKMNQHELRALEASWSLDHRDIRDELESLRTERLTSEAYRLDVPNFPRRRRRAMLSTTATSGGRTGASGRISPPPASTSSAATSAPRNRRGVKRGPTG